MAKGKTGTHLLGSYKAMPVGSLLARVAQKLPPEPRKANPGLAKRSGVKKGAIDPAEFTVEGHRRKNAGVGRPRIHLSENDLRKAIEIYSAGMAKRRAMAALGAYARQFGMGAHGMFMRIVQFAGDNHIHLPMNKPKTLVREYDCEIKNGIWIW